MKKKGSGEIAKIWWLISTSLTFSFRTLRFLLSFPFIFFSFSFSFHASDQFSILFGWEIEWFFYIYKIITNQLRFFYQHLFRFFRLRLCYPSLGNENGKQPKFTLSIPHISPRMMYSLQLTLPSRFLLLNFWLCIASGLQPHYTVLQTVGCEPWPIPRLHPCWTAAMLWRCCRHTSTGVAGAFSQWK